MSPDAALLPSVLLVTNHLEERPRGGRELLCKLNHDVLRSLLRERLAVFHLALGQRKSGYGAMLMDALRGHVDGVCPGSIAEIVRVASCQPRLARIFLDGSNLGALARALKRSLPGVEVITFFHNVEARFFLGSLRTRKSLHAAGVLLGNYVAERHAVRASDRRICLSERDSKLLKKVYGAGATDISPMALEDKLPSASPAGEAVQDKTPFALFVGGGFYANRAGIEWYVDHVTPLVGMKVRVVGRGFASHKARLEVCSNVEVVGEVDDLSTWYRDAHVVIAPIFDGSGMKTKVAEALMYGKKVAGTPEAFSGYEDALPHAGWVCSSAEEFARALNEATATPGPAMDPGLRKIFVERYSHGAAMARMAAILGEPVGQTRDQGGRPA